MCVKLWNISLFSSRLNAIIRNALKRKERERERQKKNEKKKRKYYYYPPLPSSSSSSSSSSSCLSNWKHCDVRGVYVTLKPVIQLMPKSITGVIQKEEQTNKWETKAISNEYQLLIGANLPMRRSNAGNPIPSRAYRKIAIGYIILPVPNVRD